MGRAAVAALYTTDVQTDRIHSRFNAPVIVSMNRKAARMTAATGQLVELKINYCFIVGIL